MQMQTIYTEIAIENLEALIRESERLQAIRDYVNNVTFISEDVLKALLKDGES